MAQRDIPYVDVLWGGGQILLKAMILQQSQIYEGKRHPDWNNQI